jgi:hypothetical protein
MFNTNPDNDLTIWDGNWADYIQTYLWTLYFYERYGAGPVYDVVHEPANSVLGYDNVLDNHGYSEDFADIFADWIVANYLDDPTIGDGRWGYVGETLPPFNVMGNYSSYPVPDQPRTVNHWAADYYRFSNFGAIHGIELGFDGADNNNFAVWGLALRGGGATDVYRMAVDPGTQSGTLNIGGLTDPADEIILVVGSAASYGTTSYVFNAQQSAAGVADAALPAARLSLAVGPNPTRGEVTLRLMRSAPASAQPLEVGIYDAMGRLVRGLAAGTGAAAGEVTLSWDGRDTGGRPVTPGTYFARARSGSQIRTREFLVVR